MTSNYEKVPILKRRRVYQHKKNNYGHIGEICIIFETTILISRFKMNIC